MFIGIGIKLTGGNQQNPLAALIASLFGAGQQGALYDQSDLSSAYQDRAGTTPEYAPGQGSIDPPVGLLLDKRLGLALGAENITAAADRDLSSDTGFWSKDAGVTISGGAANWAATAATFQIFRTLQIVVGQYYEVSFDITAYTLGGVRVNVGVVANQVRSAIGHYTERLVAGSTTLAFTSVGASTTLSITNLTVKPVTGNHETQATAASRPTLSGLKNLLLSTATLPTQSVTVAAVPYALQFTGTGTVTLTGASTAGPLVGGGTLTFTPTAGSLTLTVTGSVTVAQLEVGSVATSYQSVGATNATYNTSGFHLFDAYNGTNSTLAATTGGGGTAGFFFCQAIQVKGGAGTARTLWSDTGTNTGYCVRINASNQLELAAGNGTAYTTIATVATLAVGTTQLVTAWDDGVNLNVQVDSGTVASVARPVVAAGTAGFTTGCDNGAATSFFNGNMFPEVYTQGTGLTSAQRLQAQNWCKSKAGL